MTLAHESPAELVRVSGYLRTHGTYLIRCVLAQRDADDFFREQLHCTRDYLPVDYVAEIDARCGDALFEAKLYLPDQLPTPDDWESA